MDIEVKMTNEGGDLVLSGNDLAAVQGVENMPMLSMFSGDGNWWGNDLLLPNADLQFRSETEGALNSVALNSQGRATVENAMKRDVQFLIDDIPNTDVNISATIVSDNRLDLTVNFTGADFYMQWNPQAPQPIPSAPPPPPLVLWRTPWQNPDIVNPSPGSYMAYAVTNMQIEDGASVVPIGFYAMPYEVNETAFISYLNSTLAPANGLTGTFSMYGGGYIVYLQGEGENYTLTTAPEILYRNLVLNYNITFASSTADFDYQGAGSKQIVDWGNGNIILLNGNGTLQTTSNVYVGITDYNAYIYHNDTMDRYNFRGSPASSHVQLRQITGDMQPNMKRFSFRDTGGVTFPLYLPLERATLLEDLTVRGTNATAMSDQFGVAFPFNHMLNIDLRGNQLDSAAVDDLFNDFVDNSSGAIAGMVTFNTSGQTPAAPPTAASLTARNTLTLAGCAVTTD